MRLYKSITKPAKKCSHGILMHKHCLDCLDFEIESHQTGIKLLRTMRRMIVNGMKKKETRHARVGRK